MEKVMMGNKCIGIVRRNDEVPGDQQCPACYVKVIHGCDVQIMLNHLDYCEMREYVK